MLKKIPVERLRAGMFIHELCGDWMSHPFWRARFRLNGGDDLQRIVESGIRHVYIDTDKGLDDAEAVDAGAVREAVEAQMVAALATPEETPLRVSVAEEMERARRVHEQAHRVVRGMMQDVRLGRAVSLEDAEPVVEAITGSVLRNSGALIGLIGIKNKDDYTFLHSVSVCTLMIAFGRSLGLAGEDLRQAGIGGLLHDVGKMKVPDAVLNKPGRLTDAEFALIKMHPGDGHAVLLETPGIGPVPLDITRHHHERLDGSGYPDGQQGEAISSMARMAAIVDVYDAITADRCYHQGLPAAEALRKMWEWSAAHFDQKLLQAFMRCVGIYPVGSLVRLESGRLGVVIDQNEGALLTPRVRVFFSTRSNAHIPPEIVDLGRKPGHGGGDRIVSAEAPDKWGVDPARFLLREG
ncbi:MAG TPA: HD-GYP domain-containing protein [Zoogloea sp.]|uniref:HD-GYP domain-containing protein n=1 Tax=Zoogloea sp. TaxID=49181 RepID=UPI002CA21A63|nr:HD-GYP domain-containing protein [Zoogloea sp.]HMV18694.1 HD-GYP domain-containing protein [Rhodocyclaceae bacterium]HMV64844.1 HD-GYP domain-containing protein [Rhodocyclaceae bacterium]HMW50870.1 HD-GYP domain-containing protein [Rhodocyclaceae bacterium]HMY48341.1 HD-GYP domain-containing protein [Rhodocyclaceae bacterium]HMZ75276.1 HD-GYP domain-containing protein [Rhodocyclaceae bacterium]